jgi:nitric oxide reductase NorQ protein
VDNDELIVLTLKQKSDFVQTPAVKSLTDRASAYLSAGYPVHFSGPAGTGKTTLAMHVAAQLSRPVLLIHGDDEFGTSDLVGGQLGFRSSRVVDNFIHSVVKTEENFTKTWVDHRLTSACKYGFTVIYDEFNRSRPEANNVLLSILEERLLELPVSRMNEGYLAVHHNFAMIFTSNPEEYAGVHKTQDALMDRMITIAVEHYDRETEIDITKAKSGIDHRSAAIIVDIVREFRRLGIQNHLPTVRACISLAKIAVLRGASPEPGDAVFLETCRDVLRIDTIKITRDGDHAGSDWLAKIVRDVCTSAGRENGASGNGASGNGTNGHRKALGGRIRGKRA